MDDQQKPHPIIRILFAIFLITFFGGGLLLFVNLFVPFLAEGASAVISLIIMAMFVIGVIAGTCVQAITAMRRASNPSERDNDGKTPRKSDP